MLRVGCFALGHRVQKSFRIDVIKLQADLKSLVENIFFRAINLIQGIIIFLSNISFVKAMFYSQIASSGYYKI